ncbi:MAG: hypothetical protein ACRCYW_05195, partial [Aeromonas sp.]|uniref:hypothetical protein n=1 Tax=Aeromonas sp. TaxID=647 RepID=UPI003F3157BC
MVDSETGVHQLQAEELAKGKGLPLEWVTSDARIPIATVIDATCLHIWTAVCDSIGQWLKIPQEGTPPDDFQDDVPIYEASSATPAPPNPKDIPAAPWEYKMPDLSEGSPFYQASTARLREVIKGRPDEDELWTEG